jgi:YesN/AraC family two-component response regulator
MVTAQSHAPFSILFVEDDHIVRLSISRILAMQFPDATVYTAENGQFGLELYKEHTPEIVITDVNMPVMDGFEMASKIKSINTETKLIVITGYSDKNYLERFSEIGFDDYILKPIEFRKLFAAIEKCCAEIAR